jgi:hypothetical protein
MIGLQDLKVSGQYSIIVKLMIQKQNWLGRHSSTWCDVDSTAVFVISFGIGDMIFTPTN